MVDTIDICARDLKDYMCLSGGNGNCQKTPGGWVGWVKLKITRQKQTNRWKDKNFIEQSNFRIVKPNTKTNQVETVFVYLSFHIKGCQKWQCTRWSSYRSNY